MTIQEKIEEILNKYGLDKEEKLKTDIINGICSTAFLFKVKAQSIEVSCKSFEYKLDKIAHYRDAGLKIDGKIIPFVSFKFEHSIPEIPIPEITLRLYPH